MLCCDGLYQRYLVHRIAVEFDLVGVVRQITSNAKGSMVSRAWRYRNPSSFIRFLQARKLISQYMKAARPLEEKLFYVDGNPPSIPRNVPVIDVANVNEERAVQFVESLKPDLICVNGTNLLRQPMLDLVPAFRLGAINLHTGLSPYSRGGNCNLFMLLEGHPELVGLTVHHLDSGVDSGDIIFSARPELEPGDTYEMIEAKTFRLGIDLVVQAIKEIDSGQAQRIKQWVKGKLFLRKTGYVYHLFHRVEVNRLLQNGLIDRYLRDRASIDTHVTLVQGRDAAGSAAL